MTYKEKENKAVKDLAYDFLNMLFLLLILIFSGLLVVVASLLV